MRIGTTLAIVGAVALAGCQSGRTNRPIGAKRAAAGDWRQVATDADRQRLRNWRATWQAAMTAAGRADGGAMARDAALFAPDRVLDGAMPPAGGYRCRVVKLGRKGVPGAAGFVAYPAFDCRVGAGGKVVSFEKTGGSQRPLGLLFQDGTARAVFLGTLVLGDEPTALEYGRDPHRDMAGVLTRIGERRWRIALPEPQFESQLDLIDLTPAG